MKKFFFTVLTAMLLLLPVTASASEKRVSILNPTAKVAEGYYVLVPQCAPKRALTIRADSTAKYATTVSRSYMKKDSQIFYISKSTNNTYTIRNKNSKMVLGVKNASTKDGAVVRQSVWASLNSQRWYIFKRGDYYMIQSAISKRMLTVAGSSSVNNTKVYMHTYHAHMKGEHWSLVKVGGSAASQDKPSESSNKKSSKTGMSSADYAVLNNIIGAVETGGQVYGRRDYGDYTAPYTASSLEVTVTLGWGAFFGSEAQYLVQQILNKDPVTFKKIDKKGLIRAALKKNWVKTKWKPTSEEVTLLKKLIVTSTGKKIQDEMFKSLMKQYVASCTSDYTSNTWAIMMYCEIRHLGGKGGADRIFKRCKAQKSYSLDTIMWALKKDQADKSSNNQVGDSIFWSRHVKCVEFIRKYA